MTNSHTIVMINHCVKSVQIPSFFWSAFSCIRTRKNSVFGDFSSSEYLRYGLVFKINFI